MKEVKLYSSPFCKYCKNVKALLSEKGISFEEVDVTKNISAAGEMVRKTGSLALPTLYIGDKVIIGYSKQKILEALK